MSIAVEETCCMSQAAWCLYATRPCVLQLLNTPFGPFCISFERTMCSPDCPLASEHSIPGAVLPSHEPGAASDVLASGGAACACALPRLPLPHDAAAARGAPQSLRLSFAKTRSLQVSTDALVLCGAVVAPTSFTSCAVMSNQFQLRDGVALGLVGMPVQATPIACRCPVQCSRSILELANRTWQRECQRQGPRG